MGTPWMGYTRLDTASAAYPAIFDWNVSKAPWNILIQYFLYSTSHFRSKDDSIWRYFSVFWLGINSKSFNLKEDRTLYNISISIDFQLAIFGLLNKVLDYLLENVLEHAVSVVLTLWLACMGHPPLVLNHSLILFIRLNKYSILGNRSRWSRYEGRDVKTVARSRRLLQTLPTSGMALAKLLQIFGSSSYIALRFTSRSRSQYHWHTEAKMVPKLFWWGSRWESYSCYSTHAHSQYELGWVVGPSCHNDRRRQRSNRTSRSSIICISNISWHFELVSSGYILYPKKLWLMARQEIGHE